jgi:hypothetical protein
MLDNASAWQNPSGLYPCLTRNPPSEHDLEAQQEIVNAPRLQVKTREVTWVHNELTQRVLLCSEPTPVILPDVRIASVYAGPVAIEAQSLDDWRREWDSHTIGY